MVSHNDMTSSLHISVVVDYSMFPGKRFEDLSVRTEPSNRPSQTQVAGSGVEQVTGADDHSDTTTYAPDCGPETDEGLDTCQQLRLEVKRPLTETKEELWRATHGLGREIREMMQEMGQEIQHGVEREMREMQQGMGLEMSDMRHDVGREIREMQRENGAFRLEMCEMQKKMGREISKMQEMRRETSEMQKEMSEMQQKVQDISTTALHAVMSNLSSASGRSAEEGLQDVTTHLTDTGTIVFLTRLLHMFFSINAQIKYNNN